MKNLIFLLFVLTCLSSNAQILKFKSEYIRMTSNKIDSKLDLSVLIIIDLNNNEVKIYSDPIELFNIYKIYPVENLSVGNRYKFLALDSQGIEITILSTFINGDGHYMQFLYPNKLIFTYKCDPAVE